MGSRIRDFRKHLIEKYGTAPDNESITVALAEAERDGHTAAPGDIFKKLAASGIEDDLAHDLAEPLSRLPLPITRDAFSYREAISDATRCATCEHYVEELPGRLGACVLFARLGELEPSTFLLLEDVGNHMLCDLWEPGETEWQDQLEGGLADGKAPEDFDEQSLIEGAKVELEHTSDPSKAIEIAMDHLTEDESYYPKLKKAEGYAKQWRPFNTHNNTLGAVNVNDPMDKLYGEEARQALEGPGGAVEHGPNYDKHLAAAKKAWETMRARWGEAAQEYLQALIGQERDVMIAVAAKLEGEEFGTAGLRFIAREIGLGDQVPKKATREQLLELILKGLRKQVVAKKAENSLGLPPRPDFTEWARTKHLDPLVQVAEYKFGQALVKHLAENVPAPMTKEALRQRQKAISDRLVQNIITLEQYDAEQAALGQEYRASQAKAREPLLKALEVPPEQRLRTVLDGVKGAYAKSKKPEPYSKRTTRERKQNAIEAFEDLRRIIGPHVVERMDADLDPDDVSDDVMALRSAKLMVKTAGNDKGFNKDSLTFRVTSRGGRSDFWQRMGHKKVPPNIRKGWDKQERELRLAYDNFRWAKQNPDQAAPQPQLTWEEYGAKLEVLNAERSAYGVLHPFINLRSSSRTTAYHEIGHWIEYRCPGAQIAVNRFLNARLSRGNADPVPMRRFGRGYGRGEIGKKDEFDKYLTEPSEAYYTGKTYRDGATEVLSMGVQALMSDPVGFCQKDPEYAAFVIGILTGDLRRA